MSEYTKGPWVYDKRGENLVGQKGIRIRVYGSGLSFSGLPDDESVANSRLISAAPELLEALKSLRVPLKIQFDLHTRMCENEGIDITTSKAYLTAKSRVDMADAAIAKAEGR